MKKEVLVVVGSDSDRERVTGALKALDDAKVGYEFIVSSAPRNPDQTAPQVAATGNPPATAKPE